VRCFKLKLDNFAFVPATSAAGKRGKVQTVLISPSRRAEHFVGSLPSHRHVSAFFSKPYLRINTILLILFVLVTLSMECYGINETQTILFPKDVSVGKLKIGRRKSSVEAKGSISVPLGEKIELNVYHEFAKKLHELPIFQEDILLTIKFENLDMGNIDLSPLLAQKKLIGLNFKHCKFSERSISILSELTWLKELSMEFCEQDDFLLRTIGNISSLSKLEIKTGILTSSKMDFISQCKKLTNLKLSTHKIEGERLFLNLPRLKKIVVRNLGVIFPESSAFLVDFDGMQLPCLEELSLIRTGMKNKEFSSIIRFVNLKKLNLWSTRIDDKGIASLADLKKLEYVDIVAEISSIGIKSLPKSVKSLDLMATAGNDSVRAVAHLENLKTLRLSRGTGIDDGALKDLIKLKNLSYLNIGQSNISDEGILFCASELPNCYVIFLWPKRMIELGKTTNGKYLGIGINGYFPLVMKDHTGSLSKEDHELIRRWKLLTQPKLKLKKRK